MTEDEALPDPLLDPGDYTPTTLSATLFNTTSGREIGEAALPGEDPNRSGIGIVQILDQGLMMEVPYRQCALGHALLIEIFRNQPPQQVLVFKATAKVTRVIDLAPRLLIEVQWRQYSKEAWSYFLEMTNRRQLEIAAYLQKVL